MPPPPQKKEKTKKNKVNKPKFYKWLNQRAYQLKMIFKKIKFSKKMLKG